MTDRTNLLDPAAAPEEIEARSFALIEAEVPKPRPFEGPQWRVVRRMIHASADFELLSLVRFHPRAVPAGINALAKGCLIVTDTQMALCGIPQRRMQRLSCTVRCLMDDPEVAARAAEAGATRARVAVDAALEREAPAIWVVGNAPTALLRLLECIEAGRARPELIVGMPVGFVNAAESKDILMRQTVTPFVTVAGSKGGSALAASVVNALADLAIEGG